MGDLNGVGNTSAPADDPIEFFVDRPYLLVIEYQGLPLFIAQIQDPNEKERLCLTS